MMRKLLVVVLCGFVQRLECSRVKFDPAYQEPVYRHDLPNEPVYKREHFYPRELVAPAEQMLPQEALIRNEPMYGNEQMMPHPLPQQAVLPSDDYLPSDRLLQGQQFIRAEPILRREAFIRREPVLRREAFIRSEPMIRTGRIFQNGPIFREGGIFRNDPNSFAVMVSQCSCPEPQPDGEPGLQEGFFQISRPIQPMQPSPVSMSQQAIPLQQPIMAPRLFFQKPLLKPHPSAQIYQPIIAFPRIQRYFRKGCKAIPENIQFPPPPVGSPPVQEFNNEPVTFPGNFQNQGQQPESTSESVQNNPVTVRNLPSPLALAQMSSIC